MRDFKSIIRTVPDFPKPGIQYRDITPILHDVDVLRDAVDAMAAPFRDAKPDFVAGLDARGFIFGTAIALELGCGFIPIRKAGKLPFETETISYDLEYGQASLQIHTDAVEVGQRVLLVDDLIATGGTALAGVELLERLKADILGASFLVNLTYLDGATHLSERDIPVHALIDYS